MPSGAARALSGPHRATALDLVLALTLYGLFVGSLRLLVEAEDSLFHSPTGWPEYLIGAAVTLPLAARRRAPLAVLAVVTVALVWFQTLQPLNLAVTHAAAVTALYGAGRYGRPHARDIVRGLALAALAWQFALAEVPPDMPESSQHHPVGIALALALYGSAWLLGDQARKGHQHREELAARTAQLAARTTELEAERERSARQAATEERLRIARELHDILGHHVSVMGVQAAGAQRALPPDADRARGALEAIESSSRYAIEEMQRVLSLLRSDGEVSPARVPGLARLDELVDELREAGVEVTLQVDALPAMPASLELAALRVVQEALTNTLRHAGPGTSAWVRVRAEGGTLHVEVEDDGRGHPPRAAGGGTGHGLVGLRERVDLLGGQLAVGPRRPRGFRVVASLPIADTARLTRRQPDV